MKQTTLFIGYDWENRSLDERVQGHFPFDYLIDPKDFLATIKQHRKLGQDYLLTDVFPMCDRAVFVPHDGLYTPAMSYYARALQLLERPLFELDSHGLRGLGSIPGYRM